MKNYLSAIFLNCIMLLRFLRSFSYVIKPSIVLHAFDLFIKAIDEEDIN
jgi:hypothetical protein